MIKAEIRKVVLTVEEAMIEGGKEVTPPVKTGIALAVLRNPWAGQGYVEDLDPVITEIAPQLGNLLVPRLIEAMGGAGNIEAYGKAGVVGLKGEIEHASALIHTLRFGNVFRTQAEGTSFLSFVNKRGGSGATVTIPMTHKTDRSQRSHFLTAETAVMDAPAEDELIVAIAASSSGRPFARIGNRHSDVERGAV